MLIIEVELKSANTGKTSLIGVMHFWNDGSGSKTTGTYEARVIQHMGYLKDE